MASPVGSLCKDLGPARLPGGGLKIGLLLALVRGWKNLRGQTPLFLPQTSSFAPDAIFPQPGTRPPGVAHSARGRNP